MVFAHQIREAVASYLSKAIDANGFLLKFSNLSHNVHRAGEPEAVRLADSIESRLADLRAGCISELEFRSLLRDSIYASAVNNMFVPVSFPTPLNQFAVAEMGFQNQAGLSGTKREVEFGSVQSIQA